MFDPKTTLLDRRKTLVKDLNQIEAALDAPTPKDWEDAASERQDDEVLERLGTHDLIELRAVDAALERIASGEYGVCGNCGDAIAPARLEAVPTATLCRKCAN